MEQGRPVQSRDREIFSKRKRRFGMTEKISLSPSYTIPCMLYRNDALECAALFHKSPKNN
jgi:hypothetical protein